MSFADLIARGLLCKVKVYAPNMDTIGAEAVGTQAVVNAYQDFGEGRPALAYCETVSHAQHVAEQFNAAGIPAVCVSFAALPAERTAAFNLFQAGAIKVLTTVSMIDEPCLVPTASVLMMLKPTRSVALYRRWLSCVMSNRKVEGASEKIEALVIDFVGNVQRLGHPEAM